MPRPARSLPTVAAALLTYLSAVAETARAATCEEANTAAVEAQDGFFVGKNWSVHRIGWAVAGSCAALATVISGINVYLHCTNYHKRDEQRQVIRIILMPGIYAIISFFSFRWFREYVYFELLRDCYEAFVIASFLILCLLYVGRSPLEQREVMARKEKQKLIFPLCMYRYRPSKPYFLWSLKWSVLQYVILKPMLSLASIITDAFNIYCETTYSLSYAKLYLVAIDFIAVSVALYGLLLLYELAKDDLAGHRPLLKFSSIKLVIVLVFYQGFVFSILAHFDVIKATKFWTIYNISAGLNAMCVCIEMVFIAALQLFAFPASEYKVLVKGSTRSDRTPFWSSFFHSQNYSDFAIDIVGTLRFYCHRLQGKAYTKAMYAQPDTRNNLDFQAAFGLDPGHRRRTMPLETMFDSPTYGSQISPLSPSDTDPFAPSKRQMPPTHSGAGLQRSPSIPDIMTGVGAHNGRRANGFYA